jgi:hypothetical protein
VTQPGDTIQLHPGVYEDVVVIKSVGILNIDFPGSAGAGHYRIAENEIHDNSALCPGEEPGDPPLAGVGVLIVNADRDRVEDNVISTNRPADRSRSTVGSC